MRDGDQIIVIGGDGAHFSFPIDQLNNEKAARRRLTFYNSTDLLRDGNVTYRLDRSRLFASEIPLEHPELRVHS